MLIKIREAQKELNSIRYHIYTSGASREVAQPLVRYYLGELSRYRAIAKEFGIIVNNT